MAGTVYLCWCDGTACNNTTGSPFTVCDECRSFGHRPLPRPEGATDDLVEAERVCSGCNGTGRIQPYRIYETTCWDCNGRGVKS